MTKEHIDMLKPHADKFIFGYDGDYAGFKASIINARYLSSVMREAVKDYKATENIKFAMFPEGSDPCDSLKKESQ